MTKKIEQLEYIIAQNPNDEFALFALAKEYHKIGKLENAMHAFENLIVINKNYIGVYFHLAKLLEEMNDIKKALNIYEKGIEIALLQNDKHTLAELKNAKLNLLLENDI